VIHELYESVARLFQRPGVWQIVPPQDFRDRLAQHGVPETPAGGYPVTDHGGSILATPKLALVYLGAWWGEDAQLEAFASDLMNAGYLDSCSVYGVTGPFTYLGAWSGPTVTGPTVTDAQLQGIVAQLPRYGLPGADGQTLYALILPSGVTVVDGGSQSCSAFCGYHDALPDGKTFYSVHPASDCGGCNMGDPFAGFSMILAHELAEVVTDAIPGQGWYNDDTGMEVGDEWAWDPVSWGPWTVQPYQVNGLGAGYGAYNPQAPQPEPQPQPGPDIPTALAQLAVAELAISQAKAALGGLALARNADGLDYLGRRG
jgi:hypothetical protein